MSDITGQPSVPTDTVPVAEPGSAPPVAANPFQPRIREPWINPTKRRVAGALAAGIAVALLVIGFGLGAWVGHDDHRDNRFGGGFGPAHSRQFPPGGFRYGRQLPATTQPSGQAPQPALPTNAPVSRPVLNPSPAS